MANTYTIEMDIHVKKTLNSPIDTDLTEEIKEKFPKLLMGTIFVTHEPNSKNATPLFDSVDFNNVNVERKEDNENEEEDVCESCCSGDSCPC